MRGLKLKLVVVCVCVCVSDDVEDPLGSVAEVSDDGRGRGVSDVVVVRLVFGVFGGAGVVLA